MAAGKLRKVSRIYNRSASGGSQSIDLYEDLGLANFILFNLTLIIRGTMTATGGGAISGFHRDAPAGMINNWKLIGHYEPTGKNRTIFDMPPQQMFYPGNFSNGVFHALLRTSSGAAATDPFRATVPVPLRDPRFKRAGSTYIDCRDFESLNFDIKNWAADADLATTNLASVQSVQIEVEAEIMENGPAQGDPHFEPMIAYKEMPLSTTSNKLTDSGQLPWDGFATALWVQPLDDSGAGDAERVNGLLRTFEVKQGSRGLIDEIGFDAALRATWSRYNPTLTTTEVVGVVGVPLSPPWDGRDGPAIMRRDTQTAVVPGVTAITPAAGDTLFNTVIGADPVNGAERFI